MHYDHIDFKVKQKNSTPWSWQENDNNENINDRLVKTKIHIQVSIRQN